MVSDLIIFLAKLKYQVTFELDVYGREMTIEARKKGTVQSFKTSFVIAALNESQDVSRALDILCHRVKEAEDSHVS